MRPAAAIPALLALTALAGCGSTTIDSGKAESFLDGSLQPSPRSVTCPKNVTVKKGRTFACTVVAANGRRYSVTIHIVDDSGHVPYVEAPDALFAALGRWLDETEGAGSAPST